MPSSWAGTPDEARDIAIKLITAAALIEGCGEVVNYQREMNEQMIASMGDRFSKIAGTLGPEEYLQNVQEQTIALFGVAYQNVLKGRSS